MKKLFNRIRCHRNIAVLAARSGPLALMCALLVASSLGDGDLGRCTWLDESTKANAVYQDFIWLCYLLLAGTALLLDGRVLHKAISGSRPVVPLGGSVVAFVLCNAVLNHSHGAEPLFEPDYRASGEIQWTTFNPSGTSGGGGRYLFTLWADSRHWKMVVRGQDPFMGTDHTQKVAFNGTDIFSVVYTPRVLVFDPSSPSGYKPGPTVPIERGSHPGRVIAGPYPLAHSSPVQLLWLAFFGGRFVPPGQSGTLTNFPNLLMPNPRSDPAVWLCTMDYTTIRGSKNRVLDQVKYRIREPSAISENPAVYTEMDPPLTEASLEAFRARIRQLRSVGGLMVAAYNAETVAHPDGYVLPTKCNATLYSVPDVAHSNSFVQAAYTLVVSNIALSPGPTRLLPELVGTVNVEDQRVRVNTGRTFRPSVFYIAPDNRWIVTTNDPEIVAIVAKNPPREVHITAHRPFYSNVLVVLLLIAVFFPLVVLLVKARQRRRGAQGSSEAPRRIKSEHGVG
ncbi:hypothetical protein D6833_00135 [Candidatus Parcubacteria bacterium]|nr:MAG: hypothetical protein D6833_00135 [Candidatus Parcubacteria bacterium]